MKMKTLRRIDDQRRPEYQEFASIVDGMMFTHQHPYPLGEEATIEGLQSICTDCDIDWYMYEVVEIEYYESGVIGADIRNKLSPPKNLVSLLEVYFDEPGADKRDKLIQIIRKEMNQTKKSVEYIAQLL